MSSTQEVKGDVEVQTTIGTRGGVPVVIQTKTISLCVTENGVRRSELHVVETEQPLAPLLRAEIERRETANRNRFADYIIRGPGRGVALAPRTY